MTINKIGPSDPVNNINKKNKVQETQQKSSPDSIKVSKSAMSKSELIKASTIAKNAPDIRANRVAEVKAKLEDPNYINDKVINSVADKIMEDFGL
ncbi:flagellar biosynthesis anti-sigma factor FlgM [Thiospirochaeta perfilievii]|uniref:Flagellar biosynthesis anti-sigma factor FlgM n=1 Tax=Thiospirochaeta perfilievii TaxID=252967 RepID=A0A5C1QE55_9SPIO|nr:flagellar biosynthesis anti-sigma factor FlgM [Thiospirochaeta perfilievii]QEN04492.1 flagellar biosynthesis anti-sigma factor FlgM [Thiospirochaeta perfilievii]